MRRLISLLVLSSCAGMILNFSSCGMEEGCMYCTGGTLEDETYCQKDFEEIKSYFELPPEYTWQEFEKLISKTRNSTGGKCNYWHD